ncbi:MAG: tRNA 4-thiouridine(8) synthase ThiI [Deltaproteobacteria bacterium]|nr:tRNA 4-thiouridine(8) synthase ThiI [Deltaproteobacteria bacterium]
MEARIIVRLSETALKGRNRSLFEKRMAQNISRHLAPLGKFRMKRDLARLTISPAEDGPGLETALEVLRGLPGVANLSLAEPAPADPDELAGVVVEYVRRALESRPQRKNAPEPVTFRMLVERKDKGYPVRSMDMAARLGQAVLEALPGLKVDLTSPELVVNVELFKSGAMVFCGKQPGPGGLPVGTSGRAVCLLSGGIDSPVAAFMMMTRGVRVSYLNFHSYPYIGERSREKVVELVRFLSRYQPTSRLYVAPFANIQVAVRDNCPEGLRTVLYRRMMNRVANHVARRDKALALVTGESLGQVASQTMPNIRAIEDTAVLPVLQPLIGLSKKEIIDRARSIGTYPISIQPHPDCCTLFQPRSPETGARLGEVHRVEEKLPVEELVTECIEGLEISDYETEYYPTRWEA